MFVAANAKKKGFEFPKFCPAQLYTHCLEIVFSPRRPLWEAERCPVVQRTFLPRISALSPYIADYPEQVWLSGFV